jgi:L-fuconolactonase
VARFMIDELAEDVGSGHNITHTVYMQSSSAGWVRADGPEEFQPVGESEFVQGVAVQGESGRYGACRIGAGIVGTVDLSLGAEVVEPVLLQHRQVARNFRGVRFRGGQAESIPFGDAKFLSSLRVLERLDMTFDCNGPETHPLDFRGVLGGLASVAAACPSLRIIVNHCGGAVGPTAFAEEGKREEWEEGMAALAALPNVYAKVGGLQMQANGFPLGSDSRGEQAGPVSSDELLDKTHELYGHVIRLFGPKRCMVRSPLTLPPSLPPSLCTLSALCCTYRLCSACTSAWPVVISSAWHPRYAMMTLCPAAMARRSSSRIFRSTNGVCRTQRSGSEEDGPCLAPLVTPRS